MNKEFISTIKDIVEKNPTTYRSIIAVKKTNRHLFEYIMDETENFNDICFSSRIYMTLSGNKSFPKCVVCGKELKHDIPCHPINGYLRQTCSYKCAQLNPETRKKIEKTNLEKYGSKIPQQTDGYRKMMSLKMSNKTNEEKTIIKNKRKETCIEKYGCENVSQNKDIHKKVVETFKSFTKEDWNKRNEKTKNTHLEKYGVEHFFNKEKYNETISKRTEEETKTINDKRRNTNILKYGIEFTCSSEKAKNNAKISRRRNHYINNILNDDFVEPCFSIDEYMNINENIFEWKCKKCGKIFKNEIREHQSHMVRCLNCYPLIKSYSNCEKEVYDFIKQNHMGKIVENCRNIIPPYELDVYIPDLKLAFEFDGLYWHSDNKKSDKNYHLNKTSECDKKDITLIHIFENEWIYKTDIVKSRILNMLGCYKNTIYARNCCVKIVGRSESYKFQNENHLQGGVYSSINLGLYYNDELVSLMTFSKCRFDSKHEWELVRFCNRLGYHVIGSASKLLKYFERNYNPKSIVSYADRRWSKGKLYHKLGFELTNISKPNYWYFLHGTINLESRMKYQKHKLKNILKNYDPNLSETQNMRNNNYLKIYDCGNYVFEKNLKHTM